MRFIYKILIGLILFNSMLVFLAGTFAIQGTVPHESSYAINVSSNETFSSYSIAGEIFSLDGVILTIIGVTVTVGAFLSWAIKSPVPIGAAIFSSIISTLYYNGAKVIENLIPQGNWILFGIITVVGIIIGILAAFTIIEMFAGQAGADN